MEADQTLAFFDSVFEAIPTTHRPIDKSDAKAPKKAKPAGKSLLDLHEQAQSKIDAMQKVNREKSLKKIAELTE